MKNSTKLMLAASLSFGLFACGGAQEPKESEASNDKEMVKEETVEVMEVNVKPGESKVQWSGSVIGVYEHTGTVDVTDGALTIENDQVTSGNFTADLTTMVATDENYTPEEGKSKEQLIGHLSSADFFMVDSFPTATFTIKSHDPASKTITGDLTIRGNTNEETVENVNIDLENGTATGKLTFNRKEYDVAFSHPAKDVVIVDDIDLNIMLKM